MDRVEKVRLALSAEHWQMNSEMLCGKRFDTNDRMARYAQAAIAALDATPAETADERQAAIVAWLRKAAAQLRGLERKVLLFSAKFIESGEWRR